MLAGGGGNGNMHEAAWRGGNGDMHEAAGPHWSMYGAHPQPPPQGGMYGRESSTRHHDGTTTWHNNYHPQYGASGQGGQGVAVTR